jgi:hypothetical protein
LIVFAVHFGQEIYVDHPYVYVTHPHESLRRESARDSLQALRELLARPLTVTGFSSKHRMGLAKGNSSKTTQIIYKYLPAVPDIMVVRAGNGALLHFAPAMLAHLPETFAYSAGSLNPEQQRQAPLRCPHPQLASLSLPGAHHLSTLFCPVLTQQIDANHVLRDTTSSTKSNPGMLSASMTVAASTVAAPSGVSKALPAPREPMAETLLKSKDGRHNHISTDALPLSPLLLMPLSSDAMTVLLHKYLVPFNSTGPVDELLSPRQDGPAHRPVTVPQSALNILPDHARLRVCTSTFASVPAAPVEDQRRKLRCTYVLLPDDKAAEIAAAAADIPTPRRHTLGAESPKPPVVPAPCYYFVQLYQLNDTSVAEDGMHSARKALSSELDDGQDPHSTTFSLTQSGRGAPAVPGKSAFDRSITYDAEDDILRTALLQEHRAALSCDVVISPPTRAPTKDVKSQRQPNPADGTPSSKKGAASGAFSSLCASLSVGVPGQVLEDEQDEGDAEGGIDSPTGHSGGGAGQTGKRRWDPNVLSTVCRWRSCLCDSALLRVGKSSTFKQKQLCSYHLEMKAFLDARGSKQGVLESSKYLPRKAPNFSSAAMMEKKRDMMTIRAASTLLQELWDGKLRATVRSFAKKVVRDMGLRSFLEASNTSFLIAHPAYVAYLMGTTAEATVGRHANNPFSVRAYQEARPAVEQVPNSVVPAQPTWVIWKSKPYYERWDMIACLFMHFHVFSFVHTFVAQDA